MTPEERGVILVVDDNEPGLYLPGKFGIRLEDCFHMPASGPRYFSTPPPSIDEPFG